MRLREALPCAVSRSGVSLWPRGFAVVAVGGPAAGEFKLFVGGLTQTTTEEELRTLFEPYRNVSSITILQDKDRGVGKGCGFVVFSKMDSANNAIMALNGKFQMTGASKPMIVQYADTPQQREERRMKKSGGMPMGMGGFPGAGMMGAFGMPGALGMGGLAGMAGMGRGGGGGGGFPGASRVECGAACLARSSTVLRQHGRDTASCCVHAHPCGPCRDPPVTRTLLLLLFLSGMGGGMGGAPGMPGGLGALGALGGLGGLGGGYPGAGFGGMPHMPSASQLSNPIPEANLFVYNLPLEFGDTELYLTFAPYGGSRCGAMPCVVVVRARVLRACVCTCACVRASCAHEPRPCVCRQHSVCQRVHRQGDDEEQVLRLRELRQRGERSERHREHERHDAGRQAAARADQDAQGWQRRWTPLLMISFGRIVVCVEASCGLRGVLRCCRVPVCGVTCVGVPCRSFVVVILCVRVCPCVVVRLVSAFRSVASSCLVLSVVVVVFVLLVRLSS